MKVSIVTISFNQAQFLERAMRSVLEQDYPDIEYIVVDPGSTDGSREIIEGYRSRLAKVVFEPDKGPADGLNRGFSHATGEILGYLNSDDMLLPGAIAKVVRTFERRPDVDVVSGHGYFIDSRDRVTRRFRSSRFDLHRYLCGGIVLMQQATFFRRSAFLDVGGFNIENRTSWDGELWADLAARGKKFARIEEYLASFRIHDQSITGSGRLNDQYQRDIQRVFKKVMGRAPGKLEKVRFAFARLEKWLCDPYSVVVRVIDAVSIGRWVSPR